MYLNRGRRVLLFIGLSFGALAATLHVEAQDAKHEEAGATAVDVVYEPGGEVKAPKLVHYVEPEFSASSKEAFVEGTVKIATVVHVDGKPDQFKIVHGLNAEEDRTAIEALKQWRFSPGTKSGRPVNVRVTVEIDFHLL